MCCFFIFFLTYFSYHFTNLLLFTWKQWKKKIFCREIVFIHIGVTHHRGPSIVINKGTPFYYGFKICLLHFATFFLNNYLMILPWKSLLKHFLYWSHQNKVLKKIKNTFLYIKLYWYQRETTTQNYKYMNVKIVHKTIERQF